MSNPIDLSRLVQFNDLTPIDQLIDKLTKLNGAKSAKYAEALNGVVTAAEKLEKQMTDLDASEKDQQETIAKGAAQAEKLLRQNDIYSDSIKDLKGQITLLIDQQLKLKSANDKLKDSNAAEAGSLAALKAELKATTEAYMKMGDATSSAIKEEQIVKIKELAKQVNTVDKALREAKKGTVTAAGSYNQLAQEVAVAKSRLKEMEGGIGSSSKEFKDLQKFVKEGTDKLKAFDKEIGDNQRNVGNYESAVDALGERFGGLVGNIKQVGKELILLATNPFFLAIGLVIGAFALATTAVKAFFDTTGEGEDVLGRQVAAFEALKDSLKKGLADLGKEIVDFFGEGATKTIISGALRYFQFLTTTNPIISRLFELARQNFEKTVDDAIKQYDKLDILGDDLIKNIITRSQRELAANRLLEQSKNKLLFSDQERLEFLKNAVAIQEAISNTEIGFEKRKLAALQEELLLKGTNVDFLKNEIEFTQEGLDLLKEQLYTSNLIDEQKTKLSEQVAKIINLESQYFQQQRRNTTQIVALTQEIERAERERQRRRVDTEQAVLKFIYEASSRANKLIIDDENSTFEQRVEALEQMAVERAAVLALEKENELRLIQRAAEDRIRAEGREVTDALIEQDEALQNSRELINKKYIELFQNTNRELVDSIRNQFIRTLNQETKAVTDQIDTSNSEQIIALNKSYANRIISLEFYEAERQRIIAESNKKAIEEQLRNLEQQLIAFEGDAFKRLEIEKQIAALRLELSDLTNDALIANELKYRAAMKEIGNEVLNFVVTSFNARIENNIAGLERQLEHEEASAARSIAIVGDDAQAKAFIEADLARKKEEIGKQIAAQRRRQAIFEKVISASEIVVNTAKGVVSAVAASPLTFGLPWSAFVAAIGGIQLATVLAQPIPAFWKGTDYAPGGLSLVGERGRELIISPSGDAALASGPMLVDLERGAQVKDNAATESILRDAERYGDGYLMDQVLNSYGRNTDDLIIPQGPIESARIINAMEGQTKRLERAIKTQPQDIFDEKGYRHYENTVNGRILRLDNRYRLQ
jgi:hypothetical protein